MLELASLAGPPTPDPDRREPTRRTLEYRYGEDRSAPMPLAAGAGRTDNLLKREAAQPKKAGGKGDGRGSPSDSPANPTGGRPDAGGRRAGAPSPDVGFDTWAEAGDIPGPEGTSPPKPPLPSSSDKPKIRWNDRPDATMFDRDLELIVDGPILVRPNDVTGGSVGEMVEVDWLPLDENGKVVPVWRNTDIQPQNRKALWSAFGASKGVDFQPPFDNRHGWRIRIMKPPQAETHGNRAPRFYSILTPEGQKARRIPKRR